MDLLGAAVGLYSAFMASEGQQDTNTANQANAQAQMDFQERMSNTAHQREVKDLIAAGLNPMLSAKLGGSSTPGGAMSVSQNPAEAGSKAGLNAMSSMAMSTQMDNTRAQTALAEATTAKTNAERDEVIERTRTYEPNIQQTNQHINESIQRTTNMVEEIKRIGATTENLQQQSANLREVIPQIRATIDNLKAMTSLTGAQEKLAGAHTTLAAGQTAHAYAGAKLQGAQTTHTQQQISANLPALESALKDLERVQMSMRTPQMQQDEAVASGIGGVLNAVIKALNPFKGLLK